MKQTLIGMAVVVFAAYAAQQGNRAAHQFEAAMNKEVVAGDLKGAIELYKRASQSSDRAVAAKALVRMADCYERLGSAEARTIYDRVVRDYSDQKDAASTARARLAGNRAQMMTRQVWTGPGVDGEGAPSPDGRFLTFVDWATGNLAIRDLATGQNRALTRSSYQQGAEPLYSIISPDGKQVAYAWNIYANRRYNLRILPIGGETDSVKPRVLYDNAETSYVQPFDWSRDGKYILAQFTSLDKTNQIVLISVADGTTRRLKTLDWRAPGKMTFSPDGRYIVFDVQGKEESPNRDVFVLATDGSRETPLVVHPAIDGYPMWTPDGKHIVFSSDRSGAAALWSVRVADGRAISDPQMVKGDIGPVVPIGLSQSGSLYYGVPISNQRILTSAIDIATMKVKEHGREIEQRMSSGSYNYPEWSRDGRLLVYWGSAPDNPTITICSPQNKELRQLKTNLRYFGRLNWSPDGSSLLTGAEDSKGRKGIFRIDATTGASEILVQGDEGVHRGPRVSPKWSGDGKAIFYSHSSGSAQYRLLRRELNSGQETEIARGVRDWSISPDGQFVAFPDPNKQGTFQVRSLTNGKNEEVTFGQQGRLNGWTPDGAGILLKTDDSSWWRLPVRGGSPLKIDLGVTDIVAIAFHPDGERIAFTAGYPRAEIWALDNLLPTLTASR